MLKELARPLTKKSGCFWDLFTSTIMISALTVLSGCASTLQAPEKSVTRLRGDYTYTKQYISWLIQKEMKKHKVTGLSIALVDDQQIVWSEGFGYADLANNVPASSETVYMVGSISKLFTATAVMQLAEQGKIDIDQPLQTFLPEFSIKTRFPDAEPITPRTIMTHHSGLPSDWAKGALTYNTELPDLRKGYSQLVRQLRDDYVAYPPNFAFSYSNLGFSLLGLLVEKVSGKDFVSHMDESVLTPLGMTHSSFWPTPDIRSSLSKGYKKGKPAKLLAGRDLPAGSLHSNVLDMSRFMMMVFAEGMAGYRQILKPETLAEMLRPQNGEVALDLDFRIGLAWFLNWTGYNLDFAGKVALHAGDIGSFNGALMTLPEHKLGVVILANSPVVFIEEAIETLKLALEAKAGIVPPEQKPSATISLPQKELKAHEGLYATAMGMMSFKVKGKKLQGKLMGHSFQLVPQADGKFSLRYLLLGFIPIKVGALGNQRLLFADIQGRKVVALYANGMIQGVGEKAQRVAVPKVWLNRLGAYEILNAGDDYLIFKDFNFRYDDGWLILDLTVGSMPVSVSLSPVSDTEVVILGLGRYMGETIRAVTIDDEERLRYSGYELRRKKDR